MSSDKVEVNFSIRRGGISLISYNTMQVVSKEKINLFLDSSLNNCEKNGFSRDRFVLGWMQDERKHRCRLLGNINFWHYIW